MKRVLCVMSGFLLVASAASAQPPAGGAPVGIALGLQRAYADLKTNLVQSAEKMSEADYAFKPTGDIRTFGQLYGHVANAQFGQCAQARGVPNPNPQGNNFEQKTTKAEFVKGLADSFAFCDEAFSSLTDESAAQMLQGGRGGPTARSVALLGVIAHGNEMYGIGTVYLRLKGLVPPSTENQPQRGGGRGGRGRGN